MIIIVSSKIGADEIEASLGKPEYSYYFLLQEFLPALNELGTVVEAASKTEIDSLFESHSANGEQVVFLSFSPPYQTPLGLKCPTYCVFAWEFDTMPLEAWDNDPKHNWQYVFSQITGVISTSEETAKQIKALMGDSYPCCAIPSATWNKYSSVFAAGGWEPVTNDRHIPFTGTVIDSQAIAFSAEGLAHQPPQLEAEPDPPLPTKPTFFEFIKQSLAIRKAYKEEILAHDQDQPKETTQEVTEENREIPTVNNLMITGVVYT
ncbi:MAG: glycosyltransferase family 1 protein, partial [Pseudomonadales bacterium]|nr:glycosyltransferase family 1 protein [Pseudomonadales bacterium]